MVALQANLQGAVGAGEGANNSEGRAWLGRAQTPNGGAYAWRKEDTHAWGGRTHLERGTHVSVGVGVHAWEGGRVRLAGRACLEEGRTCLEGGRIRLRGGAHAWEGAHA
jgi:hypothetical protein